MIKKNAYGVAAFPLVILLNEYSTNVTLTLFHRAHVTYDITLFAMISLKEFFSKKKFVGWLFPKKCLLIFFFFFICDLTKGVV